jgi:hypothetical protein
MNQRPARERFLFGGAGWGILGFIGGGGAVRGGER